MVRELRSIRAVRRLTQKGSPRRFGAWVGSTALALAALPIASLAMTYASAGELRDDCAAIPRMLRGERNALSPAGECIAFIDGWRALADVMQAEQNVRAFCIPDSVTSVEIAARFVRAVDAAPARRADPAAVRLYRLVVERFPCAGTNKGGGG